MDLQPLPLPVTDGGWLPWTGEQARDGLAATGDAVAALRACAPGDPVALERWNDLEIALSGVLGAVRDAAEDHELEARRFATDVHLDVEVRDRLAALAPEALDAPARGVLADAPRSFRRGGVDRDEGTRERVRALDRREQELPQDHLDAADLVADILGRPHDDRAFTAWLDRRGEEHP